MVEIESFKIPRGEETEVEIVGKIFSKVEGMRIQEKKKDEFITIRYTLNLPKYRDVDTIRVEDIKQNVKGASRDVEVREDSFKNFQLGDVIIARASGVPNLRVFVDVKSSIGVDELSKLNSSIVRSLSNMGFKVGQPGVVFG